MVMLSAVLMVAGKVNPGRAGRAVQRIVLTEVNSVKDRVERRVKLVRVKDLPIEVMDVLAKLVSPPAFSAITLPRTC